MDPELTTVNTHRVQIFVGLKEGYDGPTTHIDFVKQICRDYCDDVGQCFTITPTYFVYRGGEEKGAIIGLINYPRYPSTIEQLRAHAITLATILQEALYQERVSIVCDDETIMIGSKD